MKISRAKSKYFKFQQADSSLYIASFALAADSQGLCVGHLGRYFVCE